MTDKEDKPSYVDFSTEYKDYAVFLPAVSEMYTRYIYNKTPKREPPAPLTREGMNFLKTQNNQLFFLPKVLYSAGQAAKSDNAAHNRDMVTDRPRDGSTTIIGDSGGFQIETGAIRWEGERTQRRMLKWLEANADWSMILDFPTGSIKRRGQTFYEEWLFDDKGNAVTEPVLQFLEDGTPKLDKNGNQVSKNMPKTIKHELDFWFCLDRTAENNEYFIKNRNPGATKFLNVMQGRSQDSLNDDFESLGFADLSREEQKRLLEEGQISECDAWYECMKKFSDTSIYGDRAFEGWSLAGFHKENFSATLRRVIILLYDGMLTDKKWMHFLGMGKLKNGCVYTDIQRGVREHELGNKEFTISYDVSSPFTSAAYGQVYSGATMTPENWSIQHAKMDGREYLEGAPRANDKLHCTAEARYDEFGVYEDPILGLLQGRAGSMVKHPKTGEVLWKEIPLEGPVADKLVMKDICVNTDLKLTSTWDVCSYALVMAHNVYMHCKAIFEAQRLYDQPWEEAKNHVPQDLLHIKYLVRDIMRMPRAEALKTIKENASILNSLGSGNHSDMISSIENSDLFDISRSAYVKSNKRKIEKPAEPESTFDSLFDAE